MHRQERWLECRGTEGWYPCTVIQMRGLVLSGLHIEMLTEVNVTWEITHPFHWEQKPVATTNCLECMWLSCDQCKPTIILQIAEGRY